MFGYVNVNQPELKLREYSRYRGYYCGLCTSLRKNYGGSARLALSYDTTFLVMLLTSLYEPGTSERNVRCSMHPTQKHLELSNRFTDYGADMNMLCAWYTALDHKQDRDDMKTRIKGDSLSILYKKYFRKLKDRYPEKVAAIESAMEEILRLEEENCQNLDTMANLSGKIVEQLFVYKEDEWAEELRAIGNLLGRFIYLIDAWEDLPEDLENNCYNVLTDMYKSTDSMTVFNERCHSYMTMIISDCTAHFERLPLIEDVEIMRNILYAGVWNRYYMILSKREKEAEAKTNGKNGRKGGKTAGKKEKNA